MGGNEEKKIIKVGSRKSELAQIQTRHVISQLKSLYPDMEYEIVLMSTLGDRVLNVSLPKIGEKSLFTKDLEQALEVGSVDMVVHSLKDLPTTLPNNMAIGAVLTREDPRDALVLREDFKGHTLATLPPGSIIGTSSLRRTAQLSRTYPHLKVIDIRGNLNTRLKKLDYHCTSTKICQDDNSNQNCNSKLQDGGSNSQDGGPNTQNGGPNTQDGGSDTQNGGSSRQDGSGDVQEQNGNGNTSSEQNNGNSNTVSNTVPNYAALILAQAGLARMGWQERISQVLPCKEVLYAVGQGALAVECRADNTSILQMLAPLNHPDTYCRILAERSFLKTLGGGCSAPVAIATTFKDVENSGSKQKRLKITGAVWSLNGETKIQESLIEMLDAGQVYDKKTCPFESKNKATKHKLPGSESGEPSSKVTKLENTDSEVSSCSRSNLSEGDVKNFKNKNCCRMKAMNMTMDKVEPVEIENLINIHGKLFMSCPFSEGVKGVCPVEFGVGSEVLGECPYFSETDQGFTQTLVKMHPRKSSYDIKKCPFMSNQVVAINASMSVSSLEDDKVDTNCYNVEKESKAKNCPFLKQSTSTNTSVVDQSSCKDIKLYCGLTKHFDLPESIIDKCEELGKRLANSLIEHGALDVMKSAQEYIRSTVPVASK